MRPRLAVEDLERWVEYGGLWRAVEIGEDHAVVELCTCHGEPVDRLESHDRGVLAFMRAHPPAD